MADNLYQVLQGIQVSRDEIIQAETFSRQYLRPYYPDLDLREGIALSDLVIRPFATLLAMANKGFTFYFENNTQAGVTDETPEDMVDKIMSNFFITRNLGDSAVVRTRLYFISGDRNVYIPSTATFSTDNVIFFKPSTDVQILSSEFEYDGGRDEYYYDLDLISTTQEVEASLESGDFIYHSTIDPYFLQASVLFLKKRALPKETNTQFLDRSETAISTRNLINDPSIDSIIRQEFNEVFDVVPVGYGDDEMKRDSAVVLNPITLLPEVLHMGGKVDVYVNADLEEEAYDAVTDANGVVDIPGMSLNVAYVVYDISRLPAELGEISDAETFVVEVGEMTDTGFLPLDDYHDVGFSARQHIRVTFTSGAVVGNMPVRFTLKKFSTIIGRLQAFLEDTAQRVVCADYLCRAVDAFVVDLTVQRIGGAALSQSQLASAKTVCESYFDALHAGETFVVASLVEALVRDTGITDLDVYLNATYKLYDRTFSQLYAPVTGSIVSFQACDRTQKFILGTVSTGV